MWKKDEVPSQTPVPQTQTPSGVDRAAAPPRGGERATIGRSITIKGEVTGDEDLLIQGTIDGSIDLQQHSVTVGPDGEVTASIVGRLVMVEGRVEGDIRAEEQVVLRSSASVQGDITAPRVVLEDGARFRGGVDMGDPSERASRTDREAPRRTERRSESTGSASSESVPEAEGATDAATEIRV